MARTAWPAAVRARALELYADHGAAGTKRLLASEGHEIPLSTIIAWAQRGGVRSNAAETTQAAVAAKVAIWAERRVDLVHRLGAVAEQALDRVEEETARRGGNASAAKNFATTVAILVDKAQLLSGEVTQRHGHIDPRAVINDARERGLRLVANG